MGGPAAAMAGATVATVTSGESFDGLEDSAHPRHLRLAWSNPSPPPPRRPIDLATAIEGHLSGRFGLTDQQFLRLFARREPVRPEWAAAAIR
jgi:hypothetical protein